MEFTVIIATYNSGNTLSKTLDSLLEQNFRDFECLLIDGDSKDDTINLIKSYEDVFKKKGIAYNWISEPDKGIYNAWNKGVKKAKGKWISFLGSDDIYVTGALKSYHEKICSIPSEEIIHLVYSNVDFVYKEKKIRTLKGIWLWKKFRRYMCIAHVGSFHNHLYFKKYGSFDENYKICGDYELLLRARENLKTLKMEMTTAKMQAGGISNFFIKQAFDETYRAKRNTGRVNAYLCRYDYVSAFVKYYAKKVLLLLR